MGNCPMTNPKIEKIEEVLNKVLAVLFPEPENEESRIASARVTSSRLKAFDRTKLNAQFELPEHMCPNPTSNSSQQAKTSLDQGSHNR